MTALHDIPCGRRWRAHGPHEWDATGHTATYRCDGTWHQSQIRHVLHMIRKTTTNRRTD